ncbi:hypothetical protein [Tepidibacter aestuarii]|uniref:hypothetical protein n=1 Tax=Tepidibacter aestuarii TaxID=2925782 RepID=UPI0020C03B2E|nr:hypothetical protein [Tepidibacter aestuarii]CAH2213400.1 protein of unknown function [Tepidibacter aestuarii]
MNEVRNILKLTYTKKSTPTDIEFAIMHMYGFFLLLNIQKEEAYNYLINIKKYIENINFIHTRYTVPRFYVQLIIASLDTSHLNECLEHIDYAIEYCKEYNTHSALRELYFLKSELYFNIFIKSRLKQLKQISLARNLNE